MSRLKLLAATAVAATLVAAPAFAFDHYGHRGTYGNGGAFAAGAIAGAAIGTAGAIASAPFRDSYAYYGGDGYADGPAPYAYAPGYRYGGYGTGYRNYGNSPNSTAGAGGYNTGATQPTYNW